MSTFRDPIVYPGEPELVGVRPTESMSNRLRCDCCPDLPDPDAPTRTEPAA